MVIPGEDFNMEGNIRLCYTCSEAELINGLDTLCKGLRALASAQLPGHHGSYDYAAAPFTII